MSQYQNRYGGGANPFDQRDVPASQPYASAPAQYNQQQYNQNQYNAPAMGRDDYDGGHEMEPLTGSGGQYGRQPDTTAILTEVKEIGDAIAGIEDGPLRELKNLQASALTSVDDRLNPSIENKSTQIFSAYRELIRQIKDLKQKPGAQKYPQQIVRLEGRLRQSMQHFQTVDNDHINKLNDQTARQYRLVRPDASAEEVREFVESGDTQVFAQALKQSGRQAQSQSTLRAVEDRHKEIQKIERQMVELGKLFTDMENLVVQQEAAVTNIEMKGEEVVENMDNGTKQIGVAIKSARNARKWKWWCLGICVLIIVIIVIVILIYKFVIQNNSTTVVNKTGTKRFVLTSLSENLVLPRMERAVVPGKVWVPERRALTFKA